MTPEEQNIIKNLPKVELHCHLFGSIPLPTLANLATKYDCAFSGKSTVELQKMFQFKNLTDFIRCYILQYDCVKTENDFRKITYEILLAAAAKNIKYTELRFTAPSLITRNVPEKIFWNGILEGAQQAFEETGIRVGWVIDFARNLGMEVGEMALKFALDHIEDGVVGFDISGDEAHEMPGDYSRLFKEAKAAGLGLTAHAGEAAGPDQVWRTINDFKVDRIGHGTRSIEDPELVQYLVENQIPLEVCPSSNVCLNVVPSLEDHPLPKFVEKGCFVTINTDDPTFFNNDLQIEYKKVIDTFDFSFEEILEFHRNAVKASFLSEEKRIELLLELP